MILIAQDLTYYGLDLYKRGRLADLLLALARKLRIEWIRLHYAFPTGFPQDVLTVIRTNKKVCSTLTYPYNISDSILVSMRRGTTHQKTVDLLTSFREKVPGMAIRTSLIVGYPGETNSDFETLKKWGQRNQIRPSRSIHLFA